MRPDEPQSLPSALPSSQPTQAPTDSSIPSSHQEAAANVVRGQVDTALAQVASEQEQASPYDRTHTENVQPTAEHWKQYHSAWQDYYQQYYERYYAGHLHQAHQALAQASTPQTDQDKQQIIASNQPDTISQDEALLDLRNRLVGNVQGAAKKVRKSRHFVPIASAVCVMLLFAFLQYNQILMATVNAYISPGSIDPQNIIVDPTTSTNVDPASTQVIIPKINVDVPVDYNATPDHDSQMAAMKNGLAYFGIPGADSKPGQIGNTPIAGHSSNDVLESGNYKFIFAQLDKVEKGDTIYANYKGTRYTYTVTSKTIVLPTEVNKLVYATDKPLITLITCTPLGTAQKRLLVTGEQVSPSPTKATQAPADSGQNSGSSVSIPGSAPTLFERILGQR